MLVKAWLTATQVEWHSEEDGDYTETHGWVDERWSMTELFDSRNDVHPVGVYDTDNPEDQEDYATTDDFIRAMVSEYLGAAEDNGDGTFYATDSRMSDHSLTTGIDTTYALHFNHKWNPQPGNIYTWTESPVTLSPGATL